MIKLWTQKYNLRATKVILFWLVHPSWVIFKVTNIRSMPAKVVTKANASNQQMIVSEPYSYAIWKVRNVGTNFKWCINQFDHMNDEAEP